MHFLVQLVAHLLVSLSNFGALQYRHNQIEVELRHYQEVYEGDHQ